MLLYLDLHIRYKRNILIFGSTGIISVLDFHYSVYKDAIKYIVVRSTQITIFN